MTTDGMVCSGGGSGGGSGSACIAGGCGRGHQQLTWEKLSPEEFQHLQDFAACKHSLNRQAGISYLSDFALSLLEEISFTILLRFL
jgi:hypothetical protein